MSIAGFINMDITYNAQSKCKMYEIADRKFHWSLTLYILNSYMSSSANSEDPDEMLHHAAFHQSTLFAKTKQYSVKEIQFYLRIITCDPLIYTLDHPKLIVSNLREESIVP